MRYFIDTEFIEYPNTIDLISIGIVCQDGRSFYSICNEFDGAKASQWVRNNVIVHLEPKNSGLWRSKHKISIEIKYFIGIDKPEFWGYYCDYDWVVFCWLFGTMMELPRGYPMYCKDLKQLCDSLGNPKLPEQKENEHNALADAKWNKNIYEFLTTTHSYIK